MSTDPLSCLEAHLEVLEQISLADDEPLAEPLALTLRNLEPNELERAQELLARIEQAADRLQGMQTRLRGEMAAHPRPRRDGMRRAPRSLDTTA